MVGGHPADGLGLGLLFGLVHQPTQVLGEDHLEGGFHIHLGPAGLVAEIHQFQHLIPQGGVGFPPLGVRLEPFVLVPQPVEREFPFHPLHLGGKDWVAAPGFGTG